MHTSRKGCYQICIKIGKISNFGFCHFALSLTWDHVGEKKLLTTSCLNVHNRFAHIDSCILLGRVSTKVV